MFILSCAELLENSKERDFNVHEAEIEKQFRAAGFLQYERRYKITERDDHTVICPEFRKYTKGTEPTVIIPDFLLPGRPYPIYIYMYAIYLYSTNVDKGQRWAAAETRRKFRLKTFSHTTLGRALKALVRKIEGGAAETSGATGAAAGAGAEAKPTGFPTTQATRLPREKAAQFLKGNLAGKTDVQQVKSISRKLAREWFKEHRRFLL